jgi:dihydroorotase
MRAVIGVEAELPPSAIRSHGARFAARRKASAKRNTTSAAPSVKSAPVTGNSAASGTSATGAPQKVDPAKFRSRSKNSPFKGRLLQGEVLRTIVAGRTVYEAKAR